MPESPHRLYTIKVVFINLPCVLYRWVASFTMSVIQSMARAQLYCVEQTFPFYWRMWDEDTPLHQSQWFQEGLRGDARAQGPAPSCCVTMRTVLQAASVTNVPPAHGGNHEQSGKDVKTPTATPTLTCAAGAALVAGGGEAPAALDGSSPGHHPSHELQHKVPPAAHQTVQPWVVTALGLCSEKPPWGCWVLPAV